MAISYPTSPLDPPVGRPVEVTAASVLVWSASGADVVAGVVFASNAEYRSMGRDVGMTEHELLWYGIGMIALAVAAALVADGLGRGARWARPALPLVVASHLGAAGFALTQLSWDSQRGQALATLSQVAIAAALILWVLFREAVSRSASGEPVARGHAGFE